MILRWLSTLLMLIPLVYWTTIYRFQNPTLTETQLFLGRWYLLFPIGLGMALYFWLKRLED